jgi:predicted membrane channel-forming protein YqfA (hemolysin III family)
VHWPDLRFERLAERSDERTLPASRRQSPREEIANSLSAGIGLLAALATVPLLTAATPAASNPAAQAGCLVFSVTMALSYLASTIYHALPHTPVKPDNYPQIFWRNPCGGVEQRPQDVYGSGFKER